MDIKIRELVPDDWAILREIRLEALQCHPRLFCPSQDETTFDERRWRERLHHPNSASFGVFDGLEIVGLCGIVRQDLSAASPCAHLVSAYLKAAYRQRGLSRLMYTARLDWARAQAGLTEVRVEHRASNAAARAAHQRFGFEFVESKARRWKDGSVHNTEIYSLKLEALL